MPDILARLSFYTLPEALPTYVPLLSPLLTPQSVPNTLIVILLDWSEPWHWVRQLKDWILLLREVLKSLDDDAKESMEEIMREWQQGRRGGGVTTSNETSTTILPGPGEWDEALGIPLSVVCYNVSAFVTKPKQGLIFGLVKRDGYSRNRSWLA